MSTAFGRAHPSGHPSGHTEQSCHRLLFHIKERDLKTQPVITKSKATNWLGRHVIWHAVPVGPLPTPETTSPRNFMGIGSHLRPDKVLLVSESGQKIEGLSRSA